MDWKSCFAGKVILVAEDDPLSQEMMSDVLGQMNCVVEIASDGVQAIEHFKKRHFDLIFMDIRMPNKDGITAVKEIRAMEKDGPKTPIIALSASVLGEDREQCLSAGVNEFIFKPVQFAELRAKMAEILVK